MEIPPSRPQFGLAHSLSEASVELRLNRQRLTKAKPEAGKQGQTGCGLLTCESQDHLRG